MATHNTVQDVITELGGVNAVARLTGRGETAVYNWLADRRFPASLYAMMIKQLPRGMSAPASLWGQEKARRRVAA